MTSPGTTARWQGKAVFARNEIILIQKNHVANLEGLLAQGSPNVDERYILKSESDELIDALNQSMIEEIDRQ